MKPKKKQWISVLLIRGADNSNISFSIRLSTLRILLALFLVFLAATGFFTAYYGRITARFLTVQSLVRENQELKEKVRRIGDLYGEIDRIKSYERKIKEITKNYSPDTLLAGADQPQKHDSLYNRNDDVYERDIDEFVQNIRLQRNLDFINTKDQAIKQMKVLESTPNILPVDGWISRGFQGGTDDAANDHLGIDIAAAYESPIKAAGPGIVTFAGWKNDFGFFAEIDHGYGFVSRYGHCARLIVKKGDLVDRSQTIAFVGNTGRSSAPHLHFEILKEGRRTDPMMYILK